MTSWANAEVKVYTFAAQEGDDSKMVAYKQGPVIGEDEPTTEEMSRL